MIIRTTARGTGLVGLFFSFYGKTLIHPTILKKEEENLKDIELKQSKEDLPGLFCVANSKGLLCSKPIGIGEAHLLSTKYSAIGNLISANDKGAIVSPLLKSHIKSIENALGVKATIMDVMGLDIVGALIIANNKGAIVHPGVDEDKQAAIEKALKVSVQSATIAKSGFLGALCTANEDTLIITPHATATEISNAAEILEIQ